MIDYAKTIETYGYDPKFLTQYSHRKIIVNCDYCKQDLVKSYARYNEARKNSPIQKDCCKSCKIYKQQESILASGNLPKIVEKRTKTNIERYGVSCPANLPKKDK